MTMHTYSIRTWDPTLEAYTPQIGCEPWRELTLPQLKRAMRLLQRIGYSCHRFRDSDGGHDSSDTFVLIERDDLMTDGKR